MATPATQPALVHQRMQPQVPLPRLPTAAGGDLTATRVPTSTSTTTSSSTATAPPPAPAKRARPMLDLALLCVAPSSTPPATSSPLSSGTSSSSPLWRYPQDAAVHPHLAQFCFPECASSSSRSSSSSSNAASTTTPPRTAWEDFTFTLTDAEGQRQYGFCRRFSPPLLPRSAGVEEATQEGVHTACLCLLSHHGWFGPMEQVLDALYHTLVLDQHPCLPQSPTMDDLLSRASAFVSALFASPLPSPGEPFADYKAICGELLVVPPSEQLELLRPMDNEGTLPITHGMMKALFSSLLVLRVLLLFTALLSERRIIFHSHSIQKLSHATHAASSLLYPFAWQHIFVPVLPRGLINYCEAPMPFMVGLLSSQLPLVKKMHLESVVFVDLDGNSINANIEDAAILPREHVTLLKQTIEDALYTDNRSEQVRFKVVQHAFREFFLSMLSGYRRYMVPSMDQPRSEPEFRFDRNGFIRNHPKKSVRKFLSVFCHSQMFTQFISEREAWASQGQQPQGLFEREIQAYQDLGQSGFNGAGSAGNKKEKLRTFLSQKGEEAKAKLADLREEGEKRLEKMREEKRTARFDRFDHDAPTVAVGAPSFVSHNNAPLVARTRNNPAAVASGVQGRGTAPGGGGVPGRPHGVGRASAALPTNTRPPPLPARPSGGVQSARDFWENKGGVEQERTAPKDLSERRKTLPPLPSRNALSASGSPGSRPTAETTRSIAPAPTLMPTTAARSPMPAQLAPSPAPVTQSPPARARIVRHDHPPFELRVPFDLIHTYFAPDGPRDSPFPSLAWQPPAPAPLLLDTSSLPSPAHAGPVGSSPPMDLDGSNFKEWEVSPTNASFFSSSPSTSTSSSPSPSASSSPGIPGRGDPSFLQQRREPVYQPPPVAPWEARFDDAGGMPTAGPPYTTGALRAPSASQPQPQHTTISTAPVPARNRSGTGGSSSAADLLLFDGFMPNHQELHPVLTPFSTSSPAPAYPATPFLQPLQPSSPAVGSPSYAYGGSGTPLTMAAPITPSSSSSSPSGSGGDYAFPSAPQTPIHHASSPMPGGSPYYAPSSFPSVPAYPQQPGGQPQWGQQQQQPQWGGGPAQGAPLQQQQQQQQQFYQQAHFASLQPPLQPLKPTSHAGGGLYQIPSPNGGPHHMQQQHFMPGQGQLPAAAYGMQQQQPLLPHQPMSPHQTTPARPVPHQDPFA